jgi:hypothetical protein
MVEKHSRAASRMAWRRRRVDWAREPDARDPVVSVDAAMAMSILRRATRN